MDYGIAYTDKQAKVLEKHIRSIYTEAKKDINGKLKDFNARFKVKDAKHKADLKAGLITKEEYQSWLKGQVFQGDHWKQMRAQMESILTNANEEAINIVNGGKISVIANNANYMAYTLEHGAGVNFGFALYDRSTVTNLLKEQPDLLPNKHVDPVKDGAWNRKKITRQVTLGILEGESTDQVADRLANVLSSQDQNAMLTTARTAMTGAQNVGRQLRMEEAAKKGIKLHKEWMCTLDLHTRTAHRELDGQKVPVDKPFKVDGYEIRFPADPQAEAYLVYNCRCTMVADLDDYPSVYQRYDNIDGVPVDQMTYSEWYKAKGFTDKKAKGIDYSEFGGKDVYDIFIKYKDMADWMLNAPTDEQLAIMSVSTDNVELKELFAKAHANEAEILAEKGNVAKDVIDYSEFGGKANYEIMNKYKDFDDWMYYSDPDDFFPINDLVEDGGIGKVKLLFEKAHNTKLKPSATTKGGLTSEKVAITSETQVASIKPQNTVAIDQLKYTQEAKDNAKWAKGSVQADDFYYDEGEAQINALAEYKQEAIYDYTSDSYRYNSPFYGIWDKDRLDEFDIDELPMKRESIKDLTKALNECHLESDRWLQRGTGYSEMESFFGVDIRNMSDEELEGLIGQSGRLMSFTSCGSAKGTGFTDQKVILNIYTPEGTKATYVEPISCFKGGNERETLIQRGGYYVPTKFERTWNTLYIDFEHHPEKGYLTIGQ